MPYSCSHKSSQGFLYLIFFCLKIYCLRRTWTSIPSFESSSALYITPMYSASMQKLIMQEVHQILQKVCFRCKKNTLYIESNHILQPPKYLIIIINRFSHYFVWGRRENMSPSTAGKVNSNYVRIVSQVSNAGLRISKTHSTAHCYVQRLNHSIMTHPSKTDWHQLNGITYWSHQRFDSGEQFSFGLNFGIIF